MKELFEPKSVAVIGVSREPQKIGYIVFDNLKSTYRGRIFGVNPNATEVLGEQMHKTILDIKANIDLAIICVPEKLTLQVLESCGKKKVKDVIIITSGFSEAGVAGKREEADLLEVAKKFKMRILGPNCLGVINNFNGLNASFATSVLPTKYRVGIFSQSGAMGAAMLDFANGNNFGFSYFVSLGNKLDISEVDLLKVWADDENVSVAVGYVEDIKDGAGFLEAAKKFTSKKPLILLKGGMTKAGGKAASLHTAAMTQDDVVFKAAMKEAGVILAQSLNDLFELSVSFAQNHLPKGNRIAIISNAGGPSVLAADACSEEGILLPELSGHTLNMLTKKTQAASVANPIDLRGDATAQDFKLALSVIQKDTSVDGALVIATPQAMTEIEAIAREAVAARRDTKKPILVNFIGGELVDRAREICQQGGVPVFSFPERAVRAFRFQSDFAKHRATPQVKTENHKNYKAAKSVLKFASGPLGSSRLASLLSLYGIPMAQTVLARTAKEAGAALEKVKAPAVIKIASPDILHKTDIGGVIFGVETKEAAEKAFQTIVTNAKRHKPGAKIDGVTVMETAKEGLEVIVGAKKDPVFGPVLMFGFGGIFVELVSDFSVIVAPFTREKVKEMIEQTAVSKIIKGYRTNIKYSEKKLIDAILGVGKLVCDHPEIKSIEINPLILEDNGKGVVGLDAKIDIEEV